MKSERDRLIEAKTLIKVHHFDEARAILKSMPENVTARRWLAKLDEIAPERKRGGWRWQPLVIVIVGGILLVLLLFGNLGQVGIHSTATPVIAGAALTDIMVSTRILLPTETATAVPTETTIVVPSATNTTLPTITNTPLPTATETFTPEPTFTLMPNTVEGDNGLRFRVEGIDVYGKVSIFVPTNGVFLSILGQLYNFTGSKMCVGSQDFALQINNVKYSPNDTAAFVINEDYQPDRAISRLRAACAGPGQALPMLVVFDVPPNDGSNAILSFAHASILFPFSWLSQGVAIVREMTASAPTPLPTRTPIPPTPDSGNGTRSRPYSHEYAWDIQDGVIQVDGVYPNSNAVVEADNMFNPEPDNGYMWVLVRLGFSCTLSSDETCNLDLMDFELTGTLGEIYKRERFIDLTGEFGGEVFGGSARRFGWIAFQARRNDSNFVVIVNEYGDRKFFQVVQKSW